MERGLHAVKVVLANGLEKRHRVVHVGGHLVKLGVGQGDAGVVGNARNVLLLRAMGPPILQV